MKKVIYDGMERYCAKCGEITEDRFIQNGYDRITGEKIFLLRKICPNTEYLSSPSTRHDHYSLEDSEGYSVRFYEDKDTKKMYYYSQEQ